MFIIFVSVLVDSQLLPIWILERSLLEVNWSSTSRNNIAVGLLKKDEVSRTFSLWSAQLCVEFWCWNIQNNWKVCSFCVHFAKHFSFVILFSLNCLLQFELVAHEICVCSTHRCLKFRNIFSLAFVYYLAGHPTYLFSCRAVPFLNTIARISEVSIRHEQWAFWSHLVPHPSG